MILLSHTSLPSALCNIFPVLSWSLSTEIKIYHANKLWCEEWCSNGTFLHRDFKCSVYITVKEHSGMNSFIWKWPVFDFRVMRSFSLPKNLLLVTSDYLWEMLHLKRQQVSKFSNTNNCQRYATKYIKICDTFVNNKSWPQRWSRVLFIRFWIEV